MLRRCLDVASVGLHTHTTGGAACAGLLPHRRSINAVNRAILCFANPGSFQLATVSGALAWTAAATKRSVLEDLTRLVHVASTARFGARGEPGPYGNFTVYWAFVRVAGLLFVEVWAHRTTEVVRLGDITVTALAPTEAAAVGAG